MDHVQLLVAVSSGWSNCPVWKQGEAQNPAGKQDFATRPDPTRPLLSRHKAEPEKDVLSFHVLSERARISNSPRFDLKVNNTSVYKIIQHKPALEIIHV